jgi:predicted translin family RNA/ssDNA-binding protein
MHSLKAPKELQQESESQLKAASTKWRKMKSLKDTILADVSYEAEATLKEYVDILSIYGSPKITIQGPTVICLDVEMTSFLNGLYEENGKLAAEVEIAEGEDPHLSCNCRHIFLV